MSEQPHSGPDAEDAYEGWASYATWAAHLWLTNDEASYHQARALVEQAGSFHAGGDALEAWIEAGNPLAEEASLYSDLLTQALRGIRWMDVAEALAPDDWTSPPPVGQDEPEPESDGPAGPEAGSLSDPSPPRP